MDNTTQASEFDSSHYQLPPPASFQRQTSFATDTPSFSVARAVLLLLILGVLGAAALWWLNRSPKLPAATVELIEVPTPTPVQFDRPAFYLVPVERAESAQPNVHRR